MSKPLRRHFFCCRKTNIGQHLQPHCRTLPPIPVAVFEVKIGVFEFLGLAIFTVSKIAFHFDFESIENVFKCELGNYIPDKYF